MTPGSKQNAAWSACEAPPQLEETVDPEQGLGLGVGAVQLDVAQGALSLGASLLHTGREVGALARGPAACPARARWRRAPWWLAAAGAAPGPVRGTTSRGRRWAGRRSRRAGGR